VAEPAERLARPRPSGSDSAAPRWRSSLFWVTTIALVILGTLLRLRQWSYGRSFWLDEAYLVQNFDGFDGRRLLGPLTNGQVAPHGWLWLVDLTDRDGFGDERSLRLVPLLFGCALLVAVTGLAMLVLRSRSAVLAALAVVAVLPSLIYYSNEVKQYSADAFAVTALTLATVVAMRAPARLWRLGMWAAVAGVGVWISQAMVLAIPAVAVPLLVTVVRAGRRAVLVFVALCLGVAVSVATETRLILRSAAAHGRLDAYWAPTYPPRPLTIGGTAHWLTATAQAYAGHPLGLRPGWLVLLLALLGLAAVVARRGWLVGLALVAPVGAALAAGFLRIYPPSGRLLLFTLPLVVVLLAGAVDGAALLGGLVAGRRRWLRPAPVVLPVVALALVGIVVAPAAATTSHEARNPPEVEAVSKAYAYVAAHRRPSDKVLIPVQIRPIALVYARRDRVPLLGSIRMQPPNGTCVVGREPGWLSHVARFWVIGGRETGLAPHSAGWDVAAALARTRTVEEVHVWPNAQAFLLDRTGTPGAAGPPPDRSMLLPAAVASADLSCVAGHRGS
jgi:hypothetical protein